MVESVLARKGPADYEDHRQLVKTELAYESCITLPCIKHSGLHTPLREQAESVIVREYYCVLLSKEVRISKHKAQKVAEITGLLIAKEQS